jgi:hypothetical protein
MGPLRITVTADAFVRCPPEAVWDFTQDFGRRPSWDASLIEATVLRGEPLRRVRVHCRGGLRAVFRYVRSDRPRQTSLVLEEVRSALVQGGSGAWSYEAEEGGTRWTQRNSIVLRGGWTRMLAWLVRLSLRYATRRAMRRAKATLEGAAAPAGHP